MTEKPLPFFRGEASHVFVYRDFLSGKKRRKGKFSALIRLDKARRVLVRKVNPLRRFHRFHAGSRSVRRGKHTLRDVGFFVFVLPFPRKIQGVYEIRHRIGRNFLYELFNHSPRGVLRPGVDIRNSRFIEGRGVDFRVVIILISLQKVRICLFLHRIAKPKGIRH